MDLHKKHAIQEYWLGIKYNESALEYDVSIPEEHFFYLSFVVPKK